MPSNTSVALMIATTESPSARARRSAEADRLGPSGDLMTADELTRATLTSLHGEFATVVQTADLLAA